MTANNQRYYVRFKGRVLGPIDHVKTTDLVRRGQITRQHEMSLDGKQWKAASDFPGLFVNEKSATSSDAAASASQAKSTTATAASSTANDVWYANINDENKGPVAEDVLKSWVADGTLKPDMLVWQAGMEQWQTAASVRNEWFSVSSESALSVSDLTGDLEVFADRLIKPYRWIQFIAIAGIILSIVASLATVISMVTILTSGIDFGPAALISVVSFVCQLATVAVWFVLALLMLGYANRLATLKSRRQTNYLMSATDAANRFWKFAGLALAIWIIATPIIVLIGYLISLTIPVPSNESFNPFD